MTLEHIIKDDYGQTIELTFIDVDTSAAADISSYATTIQMIFVNPAGTSSTKTAAFKTDGTDGIIEYTVDSGLFDTVGWWRVRGRAASASATLSTVEEAFYIKE